MVANREVLVEDMEQLARVVVWSKLAVLTQVFNPLLYILISKENTLRSVSPCPPCAGDVLGAYNLNSSSGCVRPGLFHPELKGLHLDALDVALLRPDALDAPWRSQVLWIQPHTIVE